MHVTWTPAPASLTLDELFAKPPPGSFRHNDMIYLGILGWEDTPEGVCYLVLALDIATPRRLLGSTVVTPVTPGPAVPPTFL
jgi:hypothetical protein